MPRILEKTERRLGEKLFLKGDRCIGPKCALTRRSYPPGARGKSRRRGRGLSEYGELLKEKQKVRFLYGLDDSDIRRYTKKGELMAGVFSSNFWRMLESRLDNAVFRLGLAPSRRIARQMVTHGHIGLNGRLVNIPSVQLKTGDTVSIKESSQRSALFRELDSRLKRVEPPVWLSLDKARKAGKVIAPPEVEHLEIDFNATKIKEFYSR